MERIEVSKDVLNLLLNYLSNRPYKEVAGLIKAVQDDLAKNKEQPSESED